MFVLGVPEANVAWNMLRKAGLFVDVVSVIITNRL